MAEGKLLTGIQPTGKPHIGNYFGAIKPAIELVSQYEDAQVFIPDYHALNRIQDREQMEELMYAVAATYIAAGLDTDKAFLYRQSDVPQTLELLHILLCFTQKGLLNRAHKYKDIVQENRERSIPDDEGVNMGIFTYPVLMAADILLLDATVIPLGKDNFQHMEIARDISERFNKHYGEEVFVMPEMYFTEDSKTIPGLDGRKMSKSYNNTIPLFEEEAKLRKLINKITTTSQDVAEPKSTEGDTIFYLYSLLATEEEKQALKAKYEAGGMGWGEAKEILFEKLNGHVAPMRPLYEELLADRSRIDAILDRGAERVRAFAEEKIMQVRKVIGMRVY